MEQLCGADAVECVAPLQNACLLLHSCKTNDSENTYISCVCSMAAAARWRESYLPHSFENACRKGCVGAVRKCLSRCESSGGATQSLMHRGFLAACECGKAKIVQALLEWDGLSHVETLRDGFEAACGWGHANVVARLLKLVSLHSLTLHGGHVVEGLQCAAACDRSTVVSCICREMAGCGMLQQAAYANAFWTAVCRNGAATVRVMLALETPWRAPHALCERAFCEACANGHVNVAAELAGLGGERRIRSAHCVRAARLNEAVWQACCTAWRRGVASDVVEGGLACEDEGNAARLVRALHRDVTWVARRGMVLLRRGTRHARAASAVGGGSGPLQARLNGGVV